MRETSLLLAHLGDQKNKPGPKIFFPLFDEKNAPSS